MRISKKIIPSFIKWVKENNFTKISGQDVDFYYYIIETNGNNLSPIKIPKEKYVFDKYNLPITFISEEEALKAIKGYLESLIPTKTINSLNIKCKDTDVVILRKNDFSRLYQKVHYLYKNGFTDVYIFCKSKNDGVSKKLLDKIDSVDGGYRIYLKELKVNSEEPCIE